MSEKILTAFGETGKELTNILEQFTQEELNAVPFEGSWTAGQVGDHILKSIVGAPDAIYGPTADAGRAPDEKVAQIKSVFLDFTTKLKSPDFILPGDGPFDKAELNAALADSWKKLAKASEELDLSPLCTLAKLPGSGPLTRLELLYFCMVHTQRHIHQLREIADVQNN